MNYSVKYLNLPISQKSFFADDLCDFDRVEYLNIAHDCVFETWHDGVFKYMKSLKAFYVSNPSCKYYTEKGVLYTDDLEILYKSVDLIEDELEEFNLNDKKGKVLVAVPPAYPTDDYDDTDDSWYDSYDVLNDAFEGQVDLYNDWLLG